MAEIVRAFDDGWRMLIVVREGPKRTALIDYGTLKHFEVETAVFRRQMRPQALDIAEDRLLRRLNRRRKFLKRAGVSVSPVVKRFIQEMGA